MANKDFSFAIKIKPGRIKSDLFYSSDFTFDLNDLRMYNEPEVLTEVKIIDFSLLEREESIGINMHFKLYVFNNFKFKPKIVLYYNNIRLFEMVSPLDVYNETSFSVTICKDNDKYNILKRMIRQIKRYNMSKEFRVLIYETEKRYAKNNSEGASVSERIYSFN